MKNGRKMRKKRYWNKGGKERGIEMKGNKEKGRWEGKYEVGRERKGDREGKGIGKREQ